MTAGRRKLSTKGKGSIEHYSRLHTEQVNNPPIGMVTPETDRDAGAATYVYDPHIVITHPLSYAHAG